VNAETAFGALQVIDEAGLTAGRDIVDDGFGGGHDARCSNPPLPNLDQPVSDIARQLVRLLIAQISGESIPLPHVVLQPALLIRASTGTPARISWV
jgi:DNA-binding LacI/PurR family transcriptional regulator